MNKKILTGLVLIIILALSISIANAKKSDQDEDYPWNDDHLTPMNFRFENMIDTHQQSKVNANGQLSGFIYIHETGTFTESGLPIANKANCLEPCRVGWVVKGVKITATLVHKGPRIWEVVEGDIPTEPGYSHFHWIGGPEKAGGLVVGDPYEGYLMKRVAPAPFFWLGGSGGGGGGGGGCSGHEMETDSGCSGDDGGCSGDDGGSDGGMGRLVPEGVDPHSNIVTEWDGTWNGGCHED